MMEKIFDVQDVNIRDMILSGFDLIFLCYIEWMVLVQEFDVLQNYLIFFKLFGNLFCFVVFIVNNNDIDLLEGF